MDHGSRMEASLESHLAFRLSSGSVPLTGNLNRGVHRARGTGGPTIVIARECVRLQAAHWAKLPAR